MQITKVNANIFDMHVHAYVNPVNCVGVSGAGLAKQFKKRFPEPQKAYEYVCKKGELQLGGVMTVMVNGALVDAKRCPEDVGDHGYIFYFPTKRHWRDRGSELSSIESGMRSLAEQIELLKIPSFTIAIPALGCGYGGLDWNVVEPVIVDALAGLEGTAYLIPPK